MKTNAVAWFEIPALDMDRAQKFYEAVLGHKLERNQMGELDMAWFPSTQGASGASGSLVCHPDEYQPSANGTIVYLHSPSGDIANEMSRVESAGGQILLEKKLISKDIGYMALFLDTEGNRVAMYGIE